MTIKLSKSKKLTVSVHNDLKKCRKIYNEHFFADARFSSVLAKMYMLRQIFKKKLFPLNSTCFPVPASSLTAKLYPKNCPRIHIIFFIKSAHFFKYESTTNVFNLFY